jgi:hypothetical protein
MCGIPTKKVGLRVDDMATINTSAAAFLGRVKPVLQLNGNEI